MATTITVRTARVLGTLRSLRVRRLLSTRHEQRCRPCSQGRSSSSSFFSTGRRQQRLPHDVGGDVSAFGSVASEIDRADELLDWEVRCHSLFAVLAAQGDATTDGLRRSIEALTPRQYESWTYYEKWAAGATTLLLEAGTVTRAEISEALFGDDELRSRTTSARSDGEPLFDVGDFVRVRPYRRDDGGGVEWRRPHVRVPGYVYGVRGVVERVCGEHKDPSFLAFGLEAPVVRLYRVRFRRRDIWPERGVEANHDNDDDDDVVEVEVYEPWLETSETSTGHAFEDRSNSLFDHSQQQQQHGSHHDHHHHHHHDHDPRPLVEKRAVDLEGEPRPGKELFFALLKVLTDKNVVTHAQIREMSERLVSAGENLTGASLVARAWTDPAFERRLLANATSAAEEIDVVASNPNAPTVLTVVKNTTHVHNLVVCTLCSCYPSGLLGIAPSWYKSREYRARAVREPRRVLLEFGTVVPATIRVRVHDSTADHRYLVLPRRPEGTEGWSEDELRALVTRDCMVGVSLPRLPTS